ncbi:MAG: tetraacyldisaccharide 4'-kinase [Pseudomonadota bacterium]
MKLKIHIANAWYENKCWLYLLWPFAKIYQFVISLRKWLYNKGWFAQTKFTIPVIVVGNITVGGTGKTSIVIWLAQELQRRHLKPGIVSRGYQSQLKNYPRIVRSTDVAAQVGDEPLLIAQATGCPVVIDPNRVQAVDYLLKNFACDIVLTDDGLQHYALGRDIEICCIDANKQFGNRLCLPAGPLREPLNRLETIDYLLVKGKNNSVNYPAVYVNSQVKKLPSYYFNYQPEKLRNCQDPLQTKAINFLQDKSVILITGIAQPENFQQTMASITNVKAMRIFADHHQFTPADFAGLENDLVIMTYKDAVKCQSLAHANCWFLEIQVQMESDVVSAILAKIAKIKNF